MNRKAFVVGVTALLALGTASPTLAAQDTPPVPIRALDPRSIALATEIIDIAYPPDSRHAMMARAEETIMTQARAAAMAASGGTLDDEARHIFDRFMDRIRTVSNRQIDEGAPALFTAIARAYARNFTYDELVQIRAFVGTPAGTAFMQRSSDLLADPDVARANTAYMAATLQALQPLEQELMEELRAYVESQGRHRCAPTGGTS
jgi:hypothetical protein